MLAFITVTMYMYIRSLTFQIRVAEREGVIRPSGAGHLVGSIVVGG